MAGYTGHSVYRIHESHTTDFLTAHFIDSLISNDNAPRRN